MCVSLFCELCASVVVVFVCRIYLHVYCLFMKLTKCQISWDLMLDYLTESLLERHAAVELQGICWPKYQILGL